MLLRRLEAIEAPEMGLQMLVVEYWYRYLDSKALLARIYVIPVPLTAVFHPKFEIYADLVVVRHVVLIGATRPTTLIEKSDCDTP